MAGATDKSLSPIIDNMLGISADGSGLDRLIEVLEQRLKGNLSHEQTMMAGLALPSTDRAAEVLLQALRDKQATMAGRPPPLPLVTDWYEAVLEASQMPDPESLSE